MQCGDGSCVWESQWCDGVKDCPAGQDEDTCGKGPHSGAASANRTQMQCIHLLLWPAQLLLDHHGNIFLLEYINVFLNFMAYHQRSG